jgi:hypothetical protein
MSLIRPFQHRLVTGISKSYYFIVFFMVYLFFYSFQLFFSVAIFANKISRKNPVLNSAG